MNLEELQQFENTALGKALMAFLSDVAECGLEYNVRQVKRSHMRSYGAVEDAHGNEGIEIVITTKPPAGIQ